MQNKTQILGHRGAKGEIFENTLAGFKHTQALLKQNTISNAYLIAGIEFDVQLTADSQLLVIHDDSLQRSCNRQDIVQQISANYAQQQYIPKHYLHLANPNHNKNYCIDANQQMLTLTDMPPLLKEYTHVELEIKTHKRTHYQNLLTALAHTLTNPAFKTLNITLTSFDTKLLFMLSYHQILTVIPRGLLIEDAFKQADLIDLALKVNANRVGIKQTLINESLITACKRYQLKTSAWTVNDFVRATDLINMGIDTIITDYPKSLHEYLNK